MYKKGRLRGLSDYTLLMADALALELVDKDLVTTDRYGRKIPKHAMGTENFPPYTSSANDLQRAAAELYDRIVDRNLLVRRLSISANKLLDEGGGAEGARGGAAGPVHRLCREGEAGAGGSGRPRSGAEAPGGHAGHQEAVRQERHPQGDEPGGWRHGQRAQPNDRRASGMSGPYDDIINLPHPTSKRHPRMPIRDRAAIFSPFAALSGHGAAIAETARLTEQKKKPVWIDITPSITVRKPEPHTMLTECEQTDSGIPAANAT